MYIYIYYTHVSISRSLDLSLPLSLCLSISLFLYLPTYLPIYLSICPIQSNLTQSNPILSNQILSI